ncbi:MAG: c-type cytochrome biogenesis protein CcsB, partial [Pseudonocardia sp.]
MTADPTLSLLSDRLFMATVGVYVLALIFHSAQYALAAGRRVPVPAGAPGEAPAPVPQAARFGRMAVALVVLGAVLHLGSLAARGYATARWPLGNMYEFTSAICLAAVVAWLVMLRRAARRPAEDAARLVAAGPFLLLPVVVLM